VSTSNAFPAERIVRLAFGVVVVPFFGALSLLLVLARGGMGYRPPKSTPADLLLIAGILLFALIGAYGLDQLVTGIRPSRTRWFSSAEEKLEDTLNPLRGRGSVTLAVVWGAPVRVHWSVIVGLILAGGLQPGAWAGFLAVILAHEVGHTVLVRRFGQRVISLSFHAIGGECRWFGQPTRLQRVSIAWGGVAGQTVLLLGAFTLVRMFPAVFSGSFGASLERALVHSNIAMAIFNLLPIPPLDGFEAWRLALPRVRRRRRARQGDAVSDVVDSALKRARRGSE
jgi:Zn-dependent protease